MQALAGVRAETTPHAARREAWLTADLRYGGCERHLLPLVDADLSDPALVSHLGFGALLAVQVWWPTSLDQLGTSKVAPALSSHKFDTCLCVCVGCP